ncbi:IS5 family transposase [Nodosilinea sp. LEGE 07298]|uniref:IS5 family transposase n=1 Tax=Nodosilinea sp. LEGE 07298 TaxID=2777970 RepID=UPI001D15CF36|nr:IS5 family transposase [Nodosilinea sp. LEGE 07298]
MTIAEINRRYQVPDALWEQLQPLIPEEPPKPQGGRPRMDDRQALEAIFYVLFTGCQWKALPRSLGAASTVHDRFQEWQANGTLARFWQAGLATYAETQGIDWEWTAMDGALVKAPLGGKDTGPNPTDRGKSGSKRSILTDGQGIPLAIVVAPANRHDMKLFEATLEAQQMVPADLATDRSRHLCLDRGYDYQAIRQILDEWGYVGHIPPKEDRDLIIRDIPNYRARRWVVERTHAWMNRFRRLLIRWEKKAENYLGFLQLASAVITFRLTGVFG